MAHDLTGQKFGKGVVIKQVEKPIHLKQGGRYWLVKCKCGNTSVVNGSYLKNGRWKNCKCINEKDLVGNKFGDGIVKKLIGPDGNGHRVWLLECKCGKKYESFTQSLTSGNTKSCGCRNERIGKNHPHYRGYEDLSWDYWCKLQNGANRRNIRFEIFIEDAWNLFVDQGKKCKLTGWDIELFSESKRKNTASLDRIDSSKHYTLDNVQWVHKDINKMKQHYSEEYFTKACKAISENKKVESCA